MILIVSRSGGGREIRSNLRGEKMEPTKAKVLLVDDHTSATSHLLNHLRKLGCVCSLRHSSDEACDLFRREEFDLILSRFEQLDNSCHELVTLSVGTRASFYYFYAVEHSCWWVPRVRFGKECWGEAALRPYQFASILKDLIQEITTTTNAENVISGNRTETHVQRSLAEPTFRFSPIRRRQYVNANLAVYADEAKVN